MKTKIVLLCLLPLLCSGCLGTMASRFAANNINRVTNGFEGGCYCIGKYPYQATYMDCDGIRQGVEDPGVPHEAAIGIFITFIALPFDCVTDTVLCVPDIIVWPFGIQKLDLKKVEKAQRKRKEKYKKCEEENHNQSASRVRLRRPQG